MPHHPPNEIENEDSRCIDCTRTDCIACAIQSATDRMHRISPDNNPFNKTIQEEEKTPASLPKTNPEPEILSQPPVEIIPSPASPQPQPEKRGRGAPQGNRNAVKHGLYISGRTIRNITPLERAQVLDFYELIQNFKEYMNTTYQNGLKAKSIEEVNASMQTLSVAVMALHRLIHLQQDFLSTTIPEEIKVTSNTTASQLQAYYQKKCDAFMDLSEIQPSPTADSTHPA